MSTMIRRCGTVISLGNGLTAKEGYDGVPTIEFRLRGRHVKTYRGSSLVFSERLTDEDKRYIASLASDLDFRAGK